MLVINWTRQKHVTAFALKRKNFNFSHLVMFHLHTRRDVDHDFKGHYI